MLAGRGGADDFDAGMHLLMHPDWQPQYVLPMNARLLGLLGTLRDTCVQMGDGLQRLACRVIHEVLRSSDQLVVLQPGARPHPVIVFELEQLQRPNILDMWQLQKVERTESSRRR